MKAKILNTSSQALSVISSVATLYTIYKGTVITLPGTQSMFGMFPDGMKIPLFILFGAMAAYFVYQTKQNKRR